MSEKELVGKISKHIDKNLRGNTPFRNTSELIAYIHKKEFEKNSKN